MPCLRLRTHAPACHCASITQCHTRSHALLQTCVVANITGRQIEYYDSLNSVDRTTIESLLRWVGDDYRDKYGCEPEGNFDVRCLARLLNQDAVLACLLPMPGRRF